jgi:hypothetical protein
MENQKLEALIDKHVRAQAEVAERQILEEQQFMPVVETIVHAIPKTMAELGDSEYDKRVAFEVMLSKLSEVIKVATISFTHSALINALELSMRAFHRGLKQGTADDVTIEKTKELLQSAADHVAQDLDSVTFSETCYKTRMPKIPEGEIV